MVRPNSTNSAWASHAIWLPTAKGCGSGRDGPGHLPEPQEEEGRKSDAAVRWPSSAGPTSANRPSSTPCWAKSGSSPSTPRAPRRDSIAVDFERNGPPLHVLVDTAGMRRRGKVFEATKVFPWSRPEGHRGRPRRHPHGRCPGGMCPTQDAHIADFIVESGAPWWWPSTNGDGLDRYVRGTDQACCSASSSSSISPSSFLYPPRKTSASTIFSVGGRRLRPPWLNCHALLAGAGRCRRQAGSEATDSSGPSRATPIRAAPTRRSSSSTACAVDHISDSYTRYLEQPSGAFRPAGHALHVSSSRVTGKEPLRRKGKTVNSLAGRGNKISVHLPSHNNTWSPPP